MSIGLLFVVLTSSVTQMPTKSSVFEEFHSTSRQRIQLLELGHDFQMVGIVSHSHYYNNKMVVVFHMIANTLYM
jgi:hypothetical protein